MRHSQVLRLRVVLSTGDQRAVAEAVAAEVAIDQVVAEVLPSQKADRMKAPQSRGEVVAMVGDGINDAPTLARAALGFAIEAATDLAIESADVTLVYTMLGIPLAAGVR